MAVGVFSPTVPQSANDILLGEGVVKANNTVIGATRGGSRLEIERVIKEIGFDGAYGPFKNMRRYDRLVPKLIINFLKLNYVTLAYGLPVTVSDGSDEDGTYKKISFDLEIAAADVLTTVKFEGQKHDGTQCVITLNNALNISNISIDFKEKDEIVAEMTYTGFYTYAAPTTVPCSIDDYVPA